jgi:hypothetical protein
VSSTGAVKRTARGNVSVTARDRSSPKSSVSRKCPVRYLLRCRSETISFSRCLKSFSPANSLICSAGPRQTSPGDLRVSPIFRPFCPIRASEGRNRRNMHADDLRYPLPPNNPQSDSERSSRPDASSSQHPSSSSAPSSPALGALSSASSSNLSSLISSVAGRTRPPRSTTTDHLTTSDSDAASLVRHIGSAAASAFSLPEEDLYESSDAAAAAAVQGDGDPGGLGVSSGGELRGLDVSVSKSQTRYQRWVDNVRPSIPVTKLPSLP